MNEMSGSRENWEKELGCPPSLCTDSVKKILNHGILSILWEEISSSIFCVDDVIETRKNILLHCLKNNIQVPLIQNIYNTKGLKTERSILNKQILDVHRECEKTDESIRKKELKLLKMKSAKQLLIPKKNILTLKCEDIRKELNDCKQMSVCCNTFLPSTNCNLNQTVMENCLSTASGIISRTDKRNAWKQISECLDDIAVPELWNWLLNKQIENTEKLVNSKLKQNIDEETPTERSNESLELSIAKAEGQRIMLTIEKLINSNKTQQYREFGEKYLNKIIESDTREVIHDWLIVALEVPQLERKQKILQSELDDIETIIKQEDNLYSQHSQLSSDIYDIDIQTEKCLKNIDTSLKHLKRAGAFLIELREELTSTLKTIDALNVENNHEWLINNNLCSEIEIFYNKLDLNAVNKIMLTEKIGAYRHASSCISKAVLFTPPIISISPVYKTPIYNLIYIFKNLVINELLKLEEDNRKIIENYKLNVNPYLNSVIESRECDIINFLDLANDKIEKCQDEVEKFNLIYDIWVRQPFDELMVINKSTVYQATYSEWIQRFTRLAFMIQCAK